MGNMGNSQRRRLNGDDGRRVEDFRVSLLRLLQVSVIARKMKVGDRKPGAPVAQWPRHTVALALVLGAVVVTLSVRLPNRGAGGEVSGGATAKKVHKTTLFHPPPPTGKCP